MCIYLLKNGEYFRRGDVSIIVTISVTVSDLKEMQKFSMLISRYTDIPRLLATFTDLSCVITNICPLMIGNNFRLKIIIVKTPHLELVNIQFVFMEC